MPFHLHLSSSEDVKRRDGPAKDGPAHRQFLDCGEKPKHPDTGEHAKSTQKTSWAPGDSNPDLSATPPGAALTYNVGSSM